MAELNETERALAVKMLRLAADQYSNHGCNDLKLPNTPENRALDRAVWAKHEDPDCELVHDESSPHIYLIDHEVMSYLADRIEEGGGESGAEFDWKHEGAADICYVKGKRVGSIMFRRNAPPGANHLTALSGVACERRDGTSVPALRKWVEERSTATPTVVSMTSPEAVDPSGTVVDEMDVTHLSLNSDGSMGLGGLARRLGAISMSPLTQAAERLKAPPEVLFIWTDGYDYYAARDLEHLEEVMRVNGVSEPDGNWTILNEDYTMHHDCEEDAQKAATALGVTLDKDSGPRVFSVTAPAAVWAARSGPGFLGSSIW